MLNTLLRRKSVAAMVRETDLAERPLKRTLGPVSLSALGIGAIIGAGIFSTAGTAAAGGAGHLGAGPALVLSFLMVAVVCSFAALCYAEWTAMVPVSGSAYTYAYATLGELVAWIIGWDLVLEYAVGNVAVAISWSGYFQELLRGLHVSYPLWLGTDYRAALQASQQLGQLLLAGGDPQTLDSTVRAAAQAWAEAPRLAGIPLVFNLPAFGIVMLLTWLLVIGIKESAAFNTMIVIVKLGFLGFFLVVGAFYVKPENWVPFAPNGFAGISSAAALIFFAYIGFDAVSTAAEESRHPQRDLPIAILTSLAVSTVVYIAVVMVLTGLLPWNQLGTAEPLATAFSARGLSGLAGFISVGAIIATTSVLLVFQLGQVRIFFSMARDGLLPGWAARVHPRYRTPHINTVVAGLAVAIFAGCANINEVVELCNIGTLFAFIIVALGIIRLRQTHPDWPRPFRVPGYPWIPLGAVLTSGYLMVELPRITWIRFFLWLAIGLIIYALYGCRHSRLRQEQPTPATRVEEKGG